MTSYKNVLLEIPNAIQITSCLELYMPKIFILQFYFSFILVSNQPKCLLAKSTPPLSSSPLPSLFTTQVPYGNNDK